MKVLVYVETDPIPVCTLHNCTEIEAGLVVHWLDALNDGGPRAADRRKARHSAVCGLGPKVIPRGRPLSPRQQQRRSQLDLF
jgi:hypothetical protein